MDYSHRVYTAEEITEMCDTWANYQGQTGENCGNCHKTANVFSGGAGWFCECGHYNAQSFNHSNIPHDNPDMGTPAFILREGHGNSIKWKKLTQ